VQRQSVISERLVETLRKARSVVVLTGAGVSAESGIPTFRDPMDGLWSKFDPLELATTEGFARDPEVVTRWYDWRREKCAAAEPNAAHLALARLELHLAAQKRVFTLLTQNVDRLHQAAGSRLWPVSFTIAAEVFDDLAGGHGFVERVEVETIDVGGEEFAALARGPVDAVLQDGFGIVGDGVEFDVHFSGMTAPHMAVNF
jgi:NAD-dependent SIR2 family protein deacetylase